MPRTAAANNMADDDRVDKSKLIRIKITSLGDGGTGKSCIIKRYCEEKFVSRYISTIGVDFGVKPMEINGYDVKVNFWDLSGHPEFYDVRNDAKQLFNKFISRLDVNILTILNMKTDFKYFSKH